MLDDMYFEEQQKEAQAQKDLNETKMLCLSLRIALEAIVGLTVFKDNVPEAIQNILDRYERDKSRLNLY
jgi:hypothetical protein